MSAAPADARAARRLAVVDQDLGAGRLERPRQWLPQAGNGPVAALLHTALEGVEAAAAGRRDDALRCFEAVAASPLPMPGAQLAAGRWLLAQGRLGAGLGALARARLAGMAVDGLIQSAARAPGAAFELQAQLIGRPGTSLWREAQLKRALLAALPRADATAAWAALFAGRGLPETHRLPLAGLADHAQRKAAAVHRYADAAALSLPLPAIVGAARPGLYAARGRRLLCAAFDDAVVAARSDLVQLPDVVLHDHEDDELAAMPADFACDAQGFDLHEGQLTLVRFGPPARRIEAAIGLVGCGSVNFGHWVGEFLPRLFLIDAAGAAADLPILVDAGMPVSHREALAWFDRHARPVIELEPGSSVQVGRLWLATSAAYAPFVPAPGTTLQIGVISAQTEALAALLDRQRRPEGPAGPRKLFLGRGGTQRRRIVNEAEVAAACAGHGFESVDLAALPFAQQLRLVHGATHIVGAAGSALLFAFLYGAPGLRVLNLHPAELAETATLTSIAAARGVEVQVLVGRSGPAADGRAANADFEIDLCGLEGMLAGWEPGAGPGLR